LLLIAALGSKVSTSISLPRINWISFWNSPS
jgi:hypothetical protein